MKTEKTIEIGAMRQKIRGRIRCSVVDGATGEVLRTYPWQKNLMLNQGMNFYATTYGGGGFIHGFQQAVAGTGTTPTQDDSGATTAAQSGTTVTLSGGSFTFTDTSTDAGKMIKWDSGEEAMVVTVTNPTEVEVNTSATIGADEFTVYRTNQIGLTTESKRTNTYVMGTGNTESVLSTNTVVVSRRTYDFSAEGVGGITYEEVGFSHSNTPGNNLMSRIRLVPSVSLLEGQIFRVIYEVTVTYQPETITPKTADVPGWPVAPAISLDGDEALVSVAHGKVNPSDGSTAAFNTGGSEFNGMTHVQVAESVITLPVSPINDVVIFDDNLGSDNTLLVESYVANSFTGVRYYVGLPNEFNSTAIRTVAFGVYVPFSHFYAVYAFVFDEGQTKDDLHKWTIRLRWTWTRELG